MTNTTDILASVKSLAPLPQTAMKLMQVINDPHAGVDDIIEAIRYDQAVTSAMLRICNSAYSGISRKINSLNDALVYLGAAKVLQLVMSVHAKTMFAAPQRGYGLEPGVLWKHSVSVALAASAFATRLDLVDTAPAYTAGLLHDIGKVVLNEYVAEEFTEIIRRVHENNVSFIEAEQEVLGCSHQEIGALLAEQWQLPEAIVRCIRYHHTPGHLNPPDALVDTVHLANCVCLMLGIGVGDDGLFTRADAEVMQRHGLREHDLEAISMETLTELKRVQALFGDGLVAAPHSTQQVEAGAPARRTQEERGDAL